MVSKTSASYIKAMAMRAVRTMAQVALSYLTIGMTVSEINWLDLLSVTVVAGVYSILTSIVTTIPEGQTDAGTLHIDSSDPNTDKYNLEVGIPLEEIKDKKEITLKVKNESKTDGAKE